MLNDGPPVEPRPSAAILLVRGSAPWEVLMMRRPGGADFAPGAFVFPGGSVHPEDSALGDEIASAAVRELFEELGILMARSAGGFCTDEDCGRLRLRVQHGVLFPRALKEAGLEPAFDELAYFARWITPEALRRRFDTRFYVARVPAGQTVHPQPGEVDDWRWVEPAQALADESFTLVFATRKILEGVADAESAELLLARARAIKEVKTVLPRVRQTETGFVVDV
jgi:8-oxo-dGTP pyrophosphatase MutT (NUDIX family)